VGIDVISDEMYHPCIVRNKTENAENQFLYAELEAAKTISEAENEKFRKALGSVRSKLEELGESFDRSKWLPARVRWHGSSRIRYENSTTRSQTLCENVRLVTFSNS
jgi:hypothetical protein